MSGRSHGYARVSTDDQDLTLQLDALTRHGIPASRIFRDKLSGARCDRPGLTKCLDVLESGDILVVWRLDRLGRSMRHLITLVEDLRERGFGFRSLMFDRSIALWIIRFSSFLPLGVHGLFCVLFARR